LIKFSDYSGISGQQEQKPEAVAARNEIKVGSIVVNRSSGVKSLL
jgi:hypothetical protein